MILSTVFFFGANFRELIARGGGLVASSTTRESIESRGGCYLFWVPTCSKFHRSSALFHTELHRTPPPITSSRPPFYVPNFPRGCFPLLPLAHPPRLLWCSVVFGSSPPERPFLWCPVLSGLALLSRCLSAPALPVAGGLV